jgi:hypothetical protein
MPDAALHVRLEAAREIVLSGFQLELYAAAERPVAYWYAKRILEADAEVLGRLLEVVPEGECSRLFWGEVQSLRRAGLLMIELFRVACASGVCVSKGVCGGAGFLVRGDVSGTSSRELFIRFINTYLLLRQAVGALCGPLDRRTRPNFDRRYKWAVNLEAEDGVPATVSPSFEDFMTAHTEIRSVSVGIYRYLHLNANPQVQRDVKSDLIESVLKQGRDALSQLQLVDDAPLTSERLAVRLNSSKNHALH